MRSARDAVVADAIAWHLSLADASSEDWARFTVWLEADTAHAAAYDRIVTDDIFATPVPEFIDVERAAVARVAEERARWRRRRAWVLAAGGAIAASISALVMLPLGAPSASGQVIVTRPGEHRSVTLADGTRIDLNGGTELAFAGADRRKVVLARGQATFRVRHDDRAPFEVVSGDIVLRDVGTVFDVTRDDRRLSVQVAEGAVVYRPDDEAVTVRAGMALISNDRDDRVILRSVAPDSVGTWRENRLSFREAPLRSVAAAVARTTGVTLAVSDELAEKPFTGTIRLSGESARDIAHIAALTGTDARRDTGRWMLTAVADAPR